MKEVTKQVHEDARKMYRTKRLVEKLWANGESVTLEVMIW